MGARPVHGRRRRCAPGARAVPLLGAARPPADVDSQRAAALRVRRPGQRDRRGAAPSGARARTAGTEPTPLSRHGSARLGLGVVARNAWAKERRIVQTVRLGADDGRTYLVANTHCTSLADRAASRRPSCCARREFATSKALPDDVDRARRRLQSHRGCRRDARAHRLRVGLLRGRPRHRPRPRPRRRGVHTAEVADGAPARRRPPVVGSRAGGGRDHMTWPEARALFPVLDRYAYLNAGTFGPLLARDARRDGEAAHLGGDPRARRPRLLRRDARTPRARSCALRRPDPGAGRATLRSRSRRRRACTSPYRPRHRPGRRGRNHGRRALRAHRAARRERRDAPRREGARRAGGGRLRPDRARGHARARG